MQIVKSKQEHRMEIEWMKQGVEESKEKEEKPQKT